MVSRVRVWMAEQPAVMETSLSLPLTLTCRDGDQACQNTVAHRHDLPRVGVRVGVRVRVRVRVLGVGLAMTCHVLEGSSLLPVETRYTRDIGEIQGRRRGDIAEI